MAIILWLIKGCLVLLLVLGFVANTLGIYLLFQCKSRENVHRIILSFSSALTLMLITHSLITGICQLDSTNKKMEVALHTNRTISAGVFITYYFTIVVLTLDRLVCLVYPVKYRLTRSKSRTVMMILAGCCILGALSLLPFLWDNFAEAKKIYDKYILLSVDVTILAVIFSTYAYIFVVTNNSQRSRVSSGSQPMRLKCLRVSLLITMSFVSFVIIPDFILVYHQFTGKTTNKVLMHVLYFLWILNYISDPIIYIYLRPDVHGEFKKKFLRKSVSLNSSMNNRSNLGIKVSNTSNRELSSIDIVNENN